LLSAFEQAPSLYQKYLDTEAFADKQFAREIRQAKQFFERNAPLYAVRDAIYRGELYEAFANLAAVITKGHEAYYILPIGEVLWRAYTDAEKTDHALATLDLLARSLTAGDLSRDTLLAWYTEVAPTRGPKRFELYILSAPPSLVSSEEQAGLTGVYTDLLTEESIDLTDFEGRFVFLDFWGTWCSPCIAEIPELLDFASEYEDRMTIISINVDAHTGGMKQDGVREFINEHEVEYTVLYDEPDNSLATRFGVTGYPAKFFINPKGAFLVHPSEDRSIVYLEEVKAYIDGLR
jgi:thiol-disulfide isomerase/thioredoxin